MSFGNIDHRMGSNKIEKIKLMRWRKCFSQEKKLSSKEEQLLKSVMMIRNNKLGENSENVMEEIRSNENFRSELIRQTVSTRDNEFILNILELMKTAFPPDESDMCMSIAGLPPVSIPSWSDQEQESPQIEQKKTSHIIHLLAANIVSIVEPSNEDPQIDILPQVAIQAIFLATIKDDPESLEAILTWTKQNEISLEELTDGCSTFDTSSISPLLVATLESYKQCAKLLLEHGFTICIHSEDKESIDEMTEHDDSFGGSIFQYYWHNLQKEDDNEKKRKAMEMEIKEAQNNWRRKRKRVKKFSAKIFKELDPLERLLRFRAFASPLYISLAYTNFTQKNGAKCNGKCSKKMCKECLFYKKELRHLDPLRKSFACATYAKTLSNFYTEYSSQYEKIAQVCRDHAEELLEQCENMEEVKIFLQDKKSENTGQDSPGHEPNWQIAIWKKHKHFVSHHYYQQFIHEKLNGEDFALGMYNWIGRVLFIPLAICLFLCYPFIVIADLFRKADILFVPPNDNIWWNDNEHSFFSFFRIQIHRAVFRKIVHFFIEMIFLIFVILTLLDPKDVDGEIDLAYYDFITPALFVLFLIDDILDVIRKKWKFLLSFWNSFSLFNNLLFVVGYGLKGYGFLILQGNGESDDRAFLSGNHPANIGSTLYAIAATLAIIRTTRWLLLNRTLGPIVTSVIKMLKDIFLFLILFFIIFVGFAFGLYFIYSIYKGYGCRLEDQSLTSASTALPALFWATLDQGNNQYSEVLNGNCNGTGDHDAKVSYEFSHFMGIVLWAVYQLVVTIMLINMLIAMMNSTYESTSESADVQWKYSRSFFHLNYLNYRSSLPPPFRLLIYYPAKFIYQYKRRSKNNLLRDEVNNSYKDKEYYDLLVELVNRKRIHDTEYSSEDDFADLRQDIRNMIENKSINVQKEERLVSENISKSLEILSQKMESFENELKNRRSNSEVLLPPMKDMKNKNIVRVYINHEEEINI